MQTLPIDTNIKNIDSPSVSTHIIFRFWNQQGNYFVKHLDEETQVYIQSIDKIKLALKHTSRNKIIEAICLCNDIFNSKDFKYKKIKGKLPLTSFFNYHQKKYNKILKQFPDYPRSWFKECIQGKEYVNKKYVNKKYVNKKYVNEQYVNKQYVKKTYIQKKYFKLNKDQFPYTTKALIKSWSKALKQNYSLPATKNIFINASIKLNNFCKNNNFRWYVICDLIDKMLNQWHSIDPQYIGILNNDRFWVKMIPNELIRYGISEEN